MTITPLGVAVEPEVYCRKASVARRRPGSRQSSAERDRRQVVGRQPASRGQLRAAAAATGARRRPRSARGGQHQPSAGRRATIASQPRRSRRGERGG